MASVLRAPATITLLPWPMKPPSHSTIPAKMALNLNPTTPLPTNSTSPCQIRSSNSDGKLPVLLFDIMDTIVRDPFYHDVPPFFGMTFEELIESKHPTAWIQFEKGLIDEMELQRKFFKDGRPFDLEDLKDCMRRGYSFVDGMKELLCSLKQNNYEMHAFTNYPIWYEMIDEKLKISRYLSWTFCSCIMGKRKPDPDFYLQVLHHLKVDPASCIFVDDRLQNVEAAMEVGIRGLHFKNAKLLHEDLSRLGISMATDDHHQLIVEETEA